MHFHCSIIHFQIMVAVLMRYDMIYSLIGTLDGDSVPVSQCLTVNVSQCPTEWDTGTHCPSVTLSQCPTFTVSLTVIHLVTHIFTSSILSSMSCLQASSFSVMFCLSVSSVSSELIFCFCFLHSSSFS